MKEKLLQSRELLLKSLSEIEEICKENQTLVLKKIIRAADQIDEVISYIGNTPSSNFLKELTTEKNAIKAMIIRLEPEEYLGNKINGYLDSYDPPASLEELQKKVGATYGGGKYQIRAVDSTGKYIKSQTVEIPGLPKVG